MILLVDYLCDLSEHLKKLPFDPKFIPKTLKITDAKNNNTLFYMNSQEDLRRIDALPTIVQSFVDINAHMVSEVTRPDSDTVYIEVKPSSIIMTVNDLTRHMTSLIKPAESWDNATVAIRKYHGGELYGIDSIQRIGREGKPCIIITAADHTVKLLEEK